MTVELRWHELDAAMLADPYGGDLDWELVVDRPRDVWEAAARAVEDANTESEAIAARTGETFYPDGQWPTGTTYGVRGTMSPVGTEGTIRDWFVDLARRMTEAGLSGVTPRSAQSAR